MNQVQIDFINNTVRPQMETIIRDLHELDTFVADYDAIQAGSDAIPEDATVMNDNRTGDAPRSDAPELTGAQIKVLRDLSASMSAIIDGPTKQTLVSRMVRALATVLSIR